MNKYFTVKVALLTLLAVPVAQAHQGHGLEGMTHDMAHSVWILGVVLAVAITLRYLPRAARQEQNRKW